MDKKEKVQIVYLNFREACGMNTKRCMEFLDWLHNEKNELIYLKNMSDLTEFELGYINKLLKVQ